MRPPKREEKEPAVLQKNEYKALLFVTQENTRDYAIIMLFLQAGLRVSELALLTGTHKVDRGMDVESLRELMGHKRKEATYHYVHLAKSNLRQLQEQTSL